MRLVHRRHWIGAARAFLRSFLVVVTVTVVQPWWLIAEFHCLEDKGVVVELEWSAANSDKRRVMEERRIECSVFLVSFNLLKSKWTSCMSSDISTSTVA